jgi:hypothetical protein|tara:strand:- start:1299 stop:1823 length:525 start_codon:yes stop_codon:yes gene_type:complete
VDIINILDRLETLINTSRKVPYTDSAIVDRTKIIELLDQMRLNIPQEIKQASEVLREKDQILNTAVMEARTSKSEAEADFLSKLNQSTLNQKAEELYTDAESKASKQLELVEQECRARRIEADTYALKSLKDLDQELNKIAGSVRKGIELLANNAKQSEQINNANELTASIASD